MDSKNFYDEKTCFLNSVTDKTTLLYNYPYGPDANCYRGNREDCSTGACNRVTSNSRGRSQTQPVSSANADQTSDRPYGTFTTCIGRRLGSDSDRPSTPYPDETNRFKFCSRSILPPKSKPCTWIPPSQRGNTNQAHTATPGQRLGGGSIGACNRNKVNPSVSVASGYSSGACSRSESTATSNCSSGACRQTLSRNNCRNGVCVRPALVSSPLSATNVARKCYGAACQAATAVKSAMTGGSKYQELGDTTELVSPQDNGKIKVGSCVLVSAPGDVHDRKGNQTVNFWGVVVHKLPGRLYKVATRQGEISRVLTQEELTLASEQRLRLSDVSRKTISFREATNMAF